MAAAMGVLAGLREAERSGTGRFLDVSMLDVAFSWGAVLLSWYFAIGQVPQRGRMPLGGGLACYRVYRCADGRWLAVGALERRFWKTLCEALGVPELVEQHPGPPAEQDAVAARLQQIFETRSRDEWGRGAVEA